MISTVLRVAAPCILVLAASAARHALAAPPEDAPIRIRAGLFDTTQPTTLGLQTIPAQHALVYQASPQTFKFCHHANLAVWRDKLFLMWSNGITHEDYNGQRILYATSVDGRSWSKPAVLAADPDGDGPLACVAAAGTPPRKRSSPTTRQLWKNARAQTNAISSTA